MPTQLLGSSAVDCDRSKAHVEDHVVEQQAEEEHGELEPAPKRPCHGDVEEDFDPSSEPGQNRQAVDDHVQDYPAKLLSHVLTREEHAAIPKDWPRPTGKTCDTPSINAYLPNLLKVSASDLHRLEGQLHRVQDAILDGLGPLINLWQALRDLRTDAEAPLGSVTVSAVVLPALQRSMVLLGSASAMIWVERRERILRKINPDPCDKASQLPPVSGQLFGETFIDNLKEHAQLSRAIAAVKRPKRDPPATAARGRSHYTQGGRTSGNRRFLGRHESAQYGGGSGARHQPYSHPQPRHRVPRQGHHSPSQQTGKKGSWPAPSGK